MIRGDVLIRGLLVVHEDGKCALEGKRARKRSFFYKVPDST